MADVTVNVLPSADMDCLLVAVTRPPASNRSISTVRVSTSGKLTAYTRGPGSPLAFNFCRTCGSVVSWRGLSTDADGRTRIAVNLRLAEQPDAVADVPLQCFDGLHSFDDLPRDGRRVRDVWF